MRERRRAPLVFGAVVPVLLGTDGSCQTGTGAIVGLRAAVVRGHAETCHRLYRECEGRVADLQKAVAALLAQPDGAKLRAARGSGGSPGAGSMGAPEFARFYGGPIDTMDPFLKRLAGR